jgi:hypothetical protein
MQAGSLRRPRVADGGFPCQQQGQPGSQDLPVWGGPSRCDLACLSKLLACKLDLMLRDQPGHPSPPEPAWLWKWNHTPTTGVTKYLENF